MSPGKAPSKGQPLGHPVSEPRYLRAEPGVGAGPREGRPAASGGSGLRRHLRYRRACGPGRGIPQAASGPTPPRPAEFPSEREGSMSRGPSPGSRGLDLPQGCPPQQLAPGPQGGVGGTPAPMALGGLQGRTSGPTRLCTRPARGCRSSLQEPWPRPRLPAQRVPAAQRPACGGVWHHGALKLGYPEGMELQGRPPSWGGRAVVGPAGCGWLLSGSELEPGCWLRWLERSSCTKRFWADPGWGGGGRHPCFSRQCVFSPPSLKINKKYPQVRIC